VARVHNDVGHAGVLADRQHRLPGLTAVGGLVQPAVAARRPQGPLRRDVDDVGVARVHEDLGDVLRLHQPDALPGGAGVGALVDAVPVADAALRLVLAGAEPDDVGIVGVDGDAAERVGAAVVEDGAHGQAAVGRLPQAAGGGGDVPDAPVARVH